MFNIPYGIHFIQFYGILYSTNLILNTINEYDKIYIHSPSIHQDLSQKLNKCLSTFIPINKIPKFFNEEDIDLVIEEVVINEDFEKSDFEIETYEPIEELRYPQENNKRGIIILDDSNEKEMKGPRVQAMFRRSRHNNLSIFVISQDYYELPKKTIRANENICHIFKPKEFLNVRIIY